MGSFSPLDVDPPLDWNVTGIPQTDANCLSFIPGKLSRSPESPVGVVLRRSSNTESAPSAPIITCLGFYREKFCLAHPCTVEGRNQMGFRTGRVVLGCREGFLDGIFLLYTLALLSSSTPMLPNTRAYCPKAGWRPQGFSWPGGLCRGVGFVRPVSGTLLMRGLCGDLSS